MKIETTTDRRVIFTRKNGDKVVVIKIEYSSGGTDYSICSGTMRINGSQEDMEKLVEAMQTILEAK